MLSKLPVLAVSFGLLLVATDAAAVMTIVSQTRSVSASADVENFTTGESDGQNVSHAAPDNGPFVQGAGANASLSGGDAGSSGTQNSTLGSNVIHAAGTCGMFAEAYEDDVESWCNGSSNFSVTFSIATSAAFTLSGLISAYDNGNTSVSLVGPGGTIYSNDAFGGETPVSESGALTPGEYTLQASTSGGSYAWWSMDYASGDYDITLNVQSTVGVEPRTTSWAGVKSAFR